MVDVATEADAYATCFPRQPFDSPAARQLARSAAQDGQRRDSSPPRPPMCHELIPSVGLSTGRNLDRINIEPPVGPIYAPDSDLASVTSLASRAPTHNNEDQGFVKVARATAGAATSVGPAALWARAKWRTIAVWDRSWRACATGPRSPSTRRFLRKRPCAGCAR